MGYRGCRGRALRHLLLGRRLWGWRVGAKPSNHGPGGLIQFLALQIVVASHSNFSQLCDVVAVLTGDPFLGAALLLSDLPAVRHLPIHRCSIAYA